MYSGCIQRIARKTKDKKKKKKSHDSTAAKRLADKNELTTQLGSPLKKRWRKYKT